MFHNLIIPWQPFFLWSVFHLELLLGIGNIQMDKQVPRSLVGAATFAALGRGKLDDDLYGMLKFFVGLYCILFLV